MLNEEILSIRSQDFLKNKMKICTNDLVNQIVENAFDSASLFNDFIEFFIELELPHMHTKHLGTIENIENNDYVNQKFDDYVNKYNTDIKDQEYKIIDLLRHAFTNFSEGGILQLYQGRETEGWYPKVIIDECIGIDEHIDELDDNIVIYRGTTIDEFESEQYGQSWTLDKNIAKGFPLPNYEFPNREKILLKTRIKKDAIYFYDKYGVEKEVIANAQKINLNPVTREKI